MRATSSLMAEFGQYVHDLMRTEEKFKKKKISKTGMVKFVRKLDSYWVENEGVYAAAWSYLDECKDKK